MLFPKPIPNILSLILFLIVSGQTFSQSHWVYVSSADQGNKEGILQLSYDSSDGILKYVKGYGELAGTGYLNFSPDKKFLYAVGSDENGEALIAYAVNAASGELTFINKVNDFGKGPCYVSVDNGNQFVLVANYSEGSICVFEKKPDGAIGKLIQQTYHKGSSINKERQNEPHPHMILPAPADDMILVPDLGTDELWLYTLTSKGAMVPYGQGAVKMPKGHGPRHFAFHPNQRFGYSLNELTGTVTSLKIQTELDALIPIQTVSALPDNFDDYNKSADIHLTPDGRYLYASNRGPNTIAVFEVDPVKGTLTRNGHFSCGGDWPRAFEVDPTGKFILSANRRTNNIAIFEIDQANGLAHQVGDVPDLGGPICLKFLLKR